MEESKNREQLERKIARYKALARQVDDEAALRIEELVRELEQQLQSQQLGAAGKQQSEIFAKL